MKASTVNHLNNILNINLPKRLHEDRSHHGVVEYITCDHTVGVVAFISEGDHARFDGEHERSDLNLKPVMVKCEHNTRVKVNREYLLNFISNMDSESVEFRFSEDMPLFIKGKVEYVIIQGIIAPIISEEEE